MKIIDIITWLSMFIVLAAGFIWLVNDIRKFAEDNKDKIEEED